MDIPLARPYITDEVKQKVNEVLDSGMLTEGRVTRELEEQFRGYLGCVRALAATSCTTGMEMALRALGVGPGDEVIVPGYTYPATADAVALTGATVVVVDVDERTLLIDYDALERAVSPRTKAILPVSLFGNPLDYGRLGPIARRHGLRIIEDAACAMGAEFQGRKAGAWADISVFSLHPRKFITTGEGGMITTDNPAWADWMESYKRFGLGPARPREAAAFERIGTNYKLSDLLAAVGVVQMRHVDALLARRREQARIYQDLLSAHPRLALPATTPGGVHSWQSFCVFVEDRDRVLAGMREKGIEVQIGTYALHLQPAFAGNPLCVFAGTLTGSHSAFQRCLALPLYHELTAADQARVIRELASL